jgi:hypothetical protein
MGQNMQCNRIGTRRKLIFAFVLGGILSFFYVAGYGLERDNSLDLTEKVFYLKWILGAFPAAGILHALWELTDRYGDRIGKAALWRRVKFILPDWLCVAILLICWLPVWLSIFPGAFAYDAFTEWEQFRDGMITSHHPVLHVLLLGGTVEGMYHLTGSYNAGIAVYTFLQMLILANVFVRTLKFMEEFQLPDIFRWFALCFYGLSPVSQLFAVSTTKDVLFSAALLIFLLNLIRFCCQRKEFFLHRGQMISFGLSAFFSMILRNNGLYIVVIILAVMLAAGGEYRKKLALIAAGICLAYGVYVGPCYRILQVTPGGIEEMLSVPLQQMARVHKYDYDSLERQDLELLYRIVPKEDLDSYRSTVSDFVKKGFQRENFQDYKKEFFSLWLKWGMQHPLTYVNSFLINTVDFWYPGAVVDGYQDEYGRSSYFDYRVSIPGEEMSFLPGVHGYYERISFDPEMQKAPFMSLLLSPGWYLVMVMVIFSRWWRNRKYTFMIPGLIFLLTMLTVLPGPMALVRYVLIFYYAFPVWLAFFLCDEHFSGY